MARGLGKELGVTASQAERVSGNGQIRVSVRLPIAVINTVTISSLGKKRLFHFHLHTPVHHRRKSGQELEWGGNWQRGRGGMKAAYWLPLYGLFSLFSCIIWDHQPRGGPSPCGRGPTHINHQPTHINHQPRKWAKGLPTGQPAEGISPS